MYRAFFDRAFVAHGVFEERNHAHHLINVLRYKVGQRMECVDKNGCVWEGEIISAGKRAMSIQILHLQENYQPKKHITLAFGNVKPARISQLIEKSTEVGVDKLIPLVTDYVDCRKFDRERMTRVAEAAASQSKRQRIPEITELSKLADLKLDLSWCVAVPEATNEVSGEFDKALIGPEGGWSDKELNEFNARGVKMVSLGKNILRSETACAVVGFVLRAR